MPDDEPRDSGAPTGEIIEDRYELRGLIGTGGVAEVWRAYDRRLQRETALKLLSGPAARDPLHRRLIEREARALAAISNTHVVGVFDYGERPVPSGEPVPYLVMELVDGPDLARHLEEVAGPLGEKDALSLFGHVLTGLDQAHRLGIVHGDLKPANVLLSPTGAKVGDFGVARILTEETGTTTVAATPAYAAPEILRGERPTPASDVYAAACILFRLLAGRPPFEGRSVYEVTNQHLHEEPPGVRELRPEVSEAVDATLRRALAKDPAERPPRAAELAAALGVPIAGGLPGRTPPRAAGTPPSGDDRAPSSAPAVTTTAPFLRERTEVLPRAPVPTPAQRALAVLSHIPPGLLIAAFAVVLLAALQESGAATVRISDLRGLEVSAAAAQADAEGFAVTEEPVDEGGVAGTVVGQEPPPGTLLMRGETIELQVTVGAPQVSVPPLTGRSVEEARTALQDAGLAIGDVAYRTTADNAPGTVLESVPPGGQDVDAGTPVDLVAAAPIPEDTQGGNEDEEEKKDKEKDEDDEAEGNGGGRDDDNGPPGGSPPGQNGEPPGQGND